ncbi:uncharacterized protein G2W53_005297 [Senna tora]|uniref:Uncharacterized protein n=1 Tax=Senna tora TaxID=362788 RepID=A0A835CHY4_9FABA|nr:uncharacterized protein G2W53_005297 [Senna tora]
MLTMSPRASSATHNFRVVLHLLRASKFESNNGRFHRNSVIMSEYSKLGSGYWIHPGKQFYTTNRSNTTSDPTGVKNANDEPQVPSSSSSFSLTNWLRWVLNSVLYLLLPLWRNWQKLRIEGKGEEVMDEVEKVAELVEKVANVAEEVAENVAENLPQDSDFRKVALVVESVSKQAAHDAHLIDQFIDKADEVKNDLDDLGSFVESITDNIAKEKSEEK